MIRLNLIFCFLLIVIIGGCNGRDKKHRESRQNEKGAAHKPNIIFIMADDLGYGDLGVYGQRLIKTPNIDRMAREGIRFTNCYAGSPVCAPSRSVLMTGQHTGHTHVRGNSSAMVDQPYPLNRVPLRPEDVTLAEVLKEAGYVTGMTGKWGLGEPGTTGIPNKQGFDEWLGFLNQNYAHNYYPEYIWKNQEKLVLQGNANGAEGEHVHNYFTDFTLDFIRRHRDTTFFLYLPVTLPHDDLEMPEADLAAYAGEEWEEEAKIYASMVTRLDKDVGGILSLLKDLEIDERTIVFFCSDNGAARRWEGQFDSSGPLKGRKRAMYEGGIRVPMVVRMPGKIKEGQVNDFPWYFADVLPTLAALAGHKAPAEIDGMSVESALFEGKQDPVNRFMYWEFHEKGLSQAVRWKSWKAVRYGLEGKLELYDLAVDEQETTDVSDERPDIVKIIEDYLNTARTASDYWPAEGEGVSP